MQSAARGIEDRLTARFNIEDARTSCTVGFPVTIAGRSRSGRGAAVSGAMHDCVFLSIVQPGGPERIFGAVPIG
ncbi:hypothetical protein AA103193_1177 [Tanticharoenia sakaeratensis NBRC 103193]|nr:hypothetical protein AA103193_1177 [Tanticharoenia sakaeratensis NBRC 103193]